MGPGNYEIGRVREYLERQRQRIAELEAENRGLRRELDELRRGVGIAVMIHGRAVPLAPLPPAGTATHPRTSIATSGQHPAVSPTPLASQVGTAFPQESWLTSPQPAVRPQPRAERSQEAWHARALRPSERITPEWLRESAASEPITGERQDVWDVSSAASASRATPSQIPVTPSRYPDKPSQTGEWPRSRSARSSRRSQTSAPLPSLPLPSEPPYPSLAQLTGHQPAVQRKPRRHANERNPYDDSFVLG